MKWTKEKCIKEVLKYKTRTELREKNYSCYDFCKKENLLDEICSHMPKKPKPNNFWTKEKCLVESNKYNSKKEFRETAFSAYSACLKNNWLEEICERFDCRKTQGYWNNIENCKKEVLKYKHRSDIQKNNPALYKAIRRNKWIDELCSFMTPIGDRLNRCIYVATFADNSIYIGLTYNYDERIREHLNTNKKRNNSAILEHYNKTDLLPTFTKITNYINSTEASLLEEKLKNEYKDKGFKILNKVKCGALGGNEILWNKDACIKEALNYKTRSELKRNKNGCYKSIHKNNWQIDCFSHMY